MEILGLDIGGSGIKGAIVNTTTGKLTTERFRIPTPQPRTTTSIAATVKEIIDHFQWTGPVGSTFPTVVIDGKCLSASNLGEEWVGVQVDDLFSQTCNGLDFHVANDADLAGIAEITIGAGKNLKGMVFMITIGTGLGTGLFYNGQLIPNFEFGHLLYNNESIEKYAADSVRKREDLSLKDWAKRFDFFLHHVIRLCSPNHFIIGGGISKKFDKFKDYLTVDVPVTCAHFKNNAGIIGAAMYAKTRPTT